MNTKQTLLALILAFALPLAACKEEESVPQEVVDQNMIISQQNAELNAKTFRTQRFPDAVRVLMDSDSTISAQCRFGDGWTSGKLEMKDGTTVPVKCQTNGRGKGFNGCLTSDDFKTKAFANEDGACNDTITSLPKFK